MCGRWEDREKKKIKLPPAQKSPTYQKERVEAQNSEFVAGVGPVI
jgi:hypothetical protein